MSHDDDLKPVYAGQHLSMVVRDDWEFVVRNTGRPAVGIVAITNAGHVVLAEQYRPPVGRRVVELPAGLTGDIAGEEHEAFLEAARRELLEETGYIAERWTELGSGYSSAGLTDESIVLFLAESLTKQGPGGGDDSEDITVHEVPRESIVGWLNERNMPVDLKLLAALYAAEHELITRA